MVFIGIGVATYLFDYGGVLLGLLLEKAGLDSEIQRTLVLFLIPVLVVVALAIGMRLGRRISTTTGSGLSTPEGHQGLILLVSKPASAMHAIQYHHSLGTLERIWLIPSNDVAGTDFGPGTVATAEQIKTQCKTTFPDLDVTVHPTGVSAADAHDTFEYVSRIYRQAGAPGDIIADFTGGTKPMTVGMIMACLPADRELEYVPFNINTGSMSGPFLIDYQHSAFGLMY